MTRLGRSERGNMIAIGAAALIPLAGLIGGGVDMSRLYLAKTRLQQACDAGALAGRKAMAAGSWTTGTGDTSEARAREFFNANFVDGAYGTRARTFTFSEANAEVTGAAYVTVPMTMMRIFNMPDRQLEVTCTAKMEIPNTDVMFVLDATGSMSGSKMNGLKSAVKCFYEALLRVNTPEVCTTNNTDPTATAYTGTAQIRLGFVPYGVNVNVGRLLLHDWMADSWVYQSRIANTRTVYAWTAGTASGGSNFSWAPESALGTTFTRASGYGTFTNVSSSVTTADGVDRANPNSAGSSSNRCTNLNTFGGRSELVGVAETYGSGGSITYSDTNSAAPVHPATGQTVEATQTRQATVTTGYRYRRFAKNGTTACYLEEAPKTGTTKSYTQKGVGTATRPVEWTPHQEFLNYTYGPREVDVSELKGTDGAWTSGITLPAATTRTGVSVTLSGQKNATTITVADSMSINWNGCIEERKTFPTSNTNPSADWATIPASALDMNIDLVPDDGIEDSHWGPLLVNNVWARYSGSASDANRVTNSFNSASNLDRNFSTGNCHINNVSRKLRQYRTAADVTNFSNYITGLVANDSGTYHDTGMLWGARLISPTGIFSDENRETPTGGNIQRHMIFMTDGNADAYTDNYGLHGIPFYDRRQTTYNPSNAQLESLTNSRLLLLCAEVKRMNIKLWVISYGGGVNAANEARLTTCASPGNFYSAADGPALRSRFQQIAAEIAELRLTN